MWKKKNGCVWFVERERESNSLISKIMKEKKNSNKKEKQNALHTHAHWLHGTCNACGRKKNGCVWFVERERE
jgi:hypothetical protein